MKPKPICYVLEIYVDGERDPQWTLESLGPFTNLAPGQVFRPNADTRTRIQSIEHFVYEVAKGIRQCTWLRVSHEPL